MDLQARVQAPLSRRAVLKSSLVASAVATMPWLARPGLATQAPASPVAQGDADDVFRALDDLIATRMAELQIPGVAYGVILGERVHATGFGVTSLDHPLPVDAETLFQIGSTGKTYTGTAVMRLVEQGKLDLEASVRTYLPDFRVADEAVSENVRLRHLVTHTAGWYGDDFTETGDGDDALERYVAEMADLPQIAPLGEHFSYNNAAFCLAGRVIEVVTGQPFEAAISELVLQPLGLEETFFFPEEIMTKAFVVGHAPPPDDPEGAPVVVGPWTDARAVNPAGGEISSARDQLRYARFHLGDGMANGKPVLSPAGMRRMQTALGPGGAIGDVFLEGFGVAWQLWQAGGVPVVSHGGSTAGQQSSFALVPEREFAVTVLTNADSGVALGMEVTDWALDAFLGLRRPPLTPVTVSPVRLAEYAGDYSFGDGITVRITERDGGLQLAIEAPDETVPPIDAPLTFVGQDLVTLEYLGITILSDFVRNDAGEVGWARFSGRMAPRAA